MPTRCLAIRTKRPLEWADLRELQRKAEPRLIVTKAEEIWCWGPRASVQEAFGTNLVSIDERAVPSDFATPSNLHVKGFLEDALGTALARDRPLLSRARRTSTTLVVDPHAQDRTLLDPVFRAVGRLAGDVSGVFAPVDEQHPEPAKVSWAEAVRVSLIQRQGETWALLDPDIWIWPPRAREAATDFLDQRREGRFNNRYNVLLDAWVQVLIGSDARRTDVTFRSFDEDDAPANAAFQINSQTAFSQRLQR